MMTVPGGTSTVVQRAASFSIVVGGSGANSGMLANRANSATNANPSTKKNAVQPSCNPRRSRDRITATTS
jgi:hypothetical protein